MGKREEFFDINKFKEENWVGGCFPIFQKHALESFVFIFELVQNLAKSHLFVFLLEFFYPRENYVEIDGERISVELAMTAEERARGLMFREELCSNCGMLFIFEKEAIYSFWMKNTLIPLDMIFINSDLEIVDIIQAFPCGKEPCEFYSSDEKALYVLEVNYRKFDEDIIGKKAKIAI